MRVRAAHRRGGALACAVVALLAAWSAGAAHGAARAHVAVVGGKAAPTGSFPWLAIVERAVSGHQAGVLCSGAVIAPNAVLTAAHCLVNPTTHVGYPVADFEVATGAVNVHSRALRVSRLSALAVYPARNYLGDAALLILATPTTAPSLPLATAADARDFVPGTPALIAGWGETYNGESDGSHGQLYWGELVVQTAQYCQAQVKSDDLTGFDSDEQVCAVDPKFKTTECYGDSGGPLIIEPSRGHFLDLGIDSSGGPGCKPTEASYFTSVPFMDPWIASVLAQVRRE